MTAIAAMYAPFRGRTLALIGLIWLIFVLFAAVFAQFLAPFDPLEIDPIVRLSEPGGDYLFGTDHFGRDTLSRCIYGARMALLIGLGAVVVSLTAGGLIGMLSAYFTRLGHVLMRVVDVLMAFPALLLALVVTLRSAPVPLGSGRPATPRRGRYSVRWLPGPRSRG